MVILESIFKFKLTRRKANEKLIDKNIFYLNLTTLNILAIINMSIFFKKNHSIDDCKAQKVF